MESVVKKIYHENYGVYGAKRIFEILKLKGYRVSYKTVYNICHKNALVSVRYKTKKLQVPKPVKEYLSSRKGQPVTNIIKLAPRTINDVWVTDWTRFLWKKRQCICMLLWIYIVIG